MRGEMPKKPYKTRNAGTFIANTISTGTTGLVFGLGGAILALRAFKGLMVSRVLSWAL